MGKFDLEKPKKYQIKPRKGINSEKSNSVKLDSIKGFLETLKR